MCVHIWKGLNWTRSKRPTDATILQRWVFIKEIKIIRKKSKKKSIHLSRISTNIFIFLGGWRLNIFLFLNFVYWNMNIRWKNLIHELLKRFLVYWTQMCTTMFIVWNMETENQSEKIFFYVSWFHAPFFNPTTGLPNQRRAGRWFSQLWQSKYIILVQNIRKPKSFWTLYFVLNYNLLIN